jgi:hypothetical protein
VLGVVCCVLCALRCVLCVVCCVLCVVCCVLCVVCGSRAPGVTHEVVSEGLIDGLGCYTVGICSEMTGSHMKGTHSFASGVSLDVCMYMHICRYCPAVFVSTLAWCLTGQCWKSNNSGGCINTTRNVHVFCGTCGSSPVSHTPHWCC